MDNPAAQRGCTVALLNDSMGAFMHRIAVAGLACCLVGCAYGAKPILTGAVNVTSSYSEKVPGKFALYVEAGEFNKVIHPRGLQCAAHSYPLNISEGFRSSARITLANLVESVEFVDVPMSIDVLRAQGYRGQIVVKGEGLESKLVAIPGFWQANISTTVVLTASVSVDGPQGRVVGRTVEGAAERETEAGPFCSGGAASVEEASGQAMRKLLVQIGEAVANSDKLRHPGRA